MVKYIFSKDFGKALAIDPVAAINNFDSTATHRYYIKVIAAYKNLRKKFSIMAEELAALVAHEDFLSLMDSPEFLEMQKGLTVQRDTLQELEMAMAQRGIEDLNIGGYKYIEVVCGTPIEKTT